MFEIEFYQELNGTKPVEEFLDELDSDMRAKVVSDLHRLKIIGNQARKPLSSHLRNGIFEMRTIFNGNIVRILYFFDKEKLIIATNGFVKKRQKTPPSEIALAERRRADYFSRKDK